MPGVFDDKGSKLASPTLAGKTSKRRGWGTRLRVHFIVPEVKRPCGIRAERMESLPCFQEERRETNEAHKSRGFSRQRMAWPVVD
jgi:hypothetical protein